MPRSSRWGRLVPVRLRSEATAIIVEPTGGYWGDQPATDIPLGGSPKSENWLARDGGIEPRPTLSQSTQTSNPLGTLVTGGTDIVSSVGTHFNLASGTTRVAWYSNGSWSPLSYVSSFGYSAPPSNTTQDRTQWVQIYSPPVDDMIAVWSVNSSYQTLFCTESGTTIFSNLTSAPRARCVAVHDNFVIAGNVRDVGSAQSLYVQRVQWSDRGNPSNWTTGLSGFEDLLDAKGGITRIVGLESRIVVFLEEEIWAGVRDVYPNIFRFGPVDQSVGCPFGMTVAETPRGIAFLARDYMVYLLPKEGGPAIPIGQRIQKRLRDNAEHLQNAWGVWNPTKNVYELYYPTGASSDLPQRSLCWHPDTGAWDPMRFDTAPHNLTCGWIGFLSTGSAAQAWNSSGISGAFTWATIPYTWNQLGASGALGAQTAFLGSSGGTIYYENSAGTNDDGTARECVWRSGALGGDTPEHIKAVNAVRVDYTATVASRITVRFSRDQGNTFDSGQGIALAQADAQMTGVGHPYTAARYPLFEVTTSDSNVRLHRFWIASRMGGR